MKRPRQLRRFAKGRSLHFQRFEITQQFVEEMHEKVEKLYSKFSRKPKQLTDKESPQRTTCSSSPLFDQLASDSGLSEQLWSAIRSICPGEVLRFRENDSLLQQSVRETASILENWSRRSEPEPSSPASHILAVLQETVDTLSNRVYKPLYTRFYKRAKKELQIRLGESTHSLWPPSAKCTRTRSTRWR
jgi:hypothetical protein